MRIGFDVDGVLAAFIPAYEVMFATLTGRNNFPPLEADGPPEWNWPDRYGYTPGETKFVWDRIKTHKSFWEKLGTTAEFKVFRDWYHKEVMDRGKNEIYFITNRPGYRPKHQTEEWFFNNVGETPTVLISEAKGLVANALNLDFYLDDKLENIQDVDALSPKTKGYLLDRQYNRHGSTKHRVASIAEFLQVVDSN